MFKLFQWAPSYFVIMNIYIFKLVMKINISIHHINIYIFRLVKGDGEILEEIVSKDKHREINKVGWIN